MRKSSHKTVIGVVRDYLDQWRKERGLTLQGAATQSTQVKGAHVSRPFASMAYAA